MNKYVTRIYLQTMYVFDVVFDVM